MPTINFDIARFDDLVLPWFRECRPKILVVTDGLNFIPGQDFGLTAFVDVLRNSTIHNMTPSVITAGYNPTSAAALSYDATAQHITNYRFTDATHGLTKARYDVVFMLPSSSDGAYDIEAEEPGSLAAISAFMEAGGGVFATGDHATLGASMCKDIHRVNSMRYWTAPDVPSAGGVDRLTTNLPGANDVYEFDDQSDALPQRLYVNFRTTAGGVGSPHPLLQVPGASRAIEVFPDHPHEGECVVPANAGVSAEWPASTATGLAVEPEMVALTMSHGNAFPGKQAVVPRSFMAICAYDGHQANVGRVATDATWHHFINVNIEPGLSALAGRDLDDIHQYYINLATWLMPKNVRRCRRYYWLLTDLLAYPLFEELDPLPPVEMTAQDFRDMGALVVASLGAKFSRGEVNQLIDDALEDVMGPEVRENLRNLAKEVGEEGVQGLGLAAVGGLVHGTASLFEEIRNRKDMDGPKAFDEAARPAVARAAKAYLADLRKNLSQMDRLFAELEKSA